MYASTTPAATAHRSSAAAPSARYWYQPRYWRGKPLRATSDWFSAVFVEGVSGSPSTVAPAPRSARKVVALARLTTSAATGPSASTAHRLIAYQGMPCDA